MSLCGTGLRRAAVLAGLVLGLTLSAQAHPHVWVTVETTVLYEKGTFVGLRHKWTFDEFYTAMAVEGLDKNKDGKYDREELAELAKVNIDALKDFDFFTFPLLGGDALKLGVPRDYWLEHSNGILSLHFTLPFASPVLLEAKGLSFTVQDPSFYIAFELAKGQHPVRLGEGAPKTCALKIGEPGGDPGKASPLEAFSGIAGVSAGPKAVTVECNGP
jgi:ABC-type uncharacterized transport system substrate-binding protein